MWVEEERPIAEVVVEDHGAIRARDGEGRVVEAARARRGAVTARGDEGSR
jgi:hypothetical protein